MAATLSEEQNEGFRAEWRACEPRPELSRWAAVALALAERAGQRDRGVQCVELPEAPFEVAAKVGRGSPWKRRLRSWIGAPCRSERAWRVACALERAGIPAPRPLGWVSSADGSLDVYLAEWIEAPSLADRLRTEGSAHAPQAGDVDIGNFIDRAGAVVAALHAANFTHRDLKAANLLARAREGVPEVLVTDLDGARSRATVPALRRRARDLGRLRASLEALGASSQISTLLAGYVRRIGSEADLRTLESATARYAAKKRAINERRGRPLE